jgi:hypothetical protein
METFHGLFCMQQVIHPALILSNEGEKARVMFYSGFVYQCYGHLVYFSYVLFCPLDPLQCYAFRTLLHKTNEEPVN